MKFIIIPLFLVLQQITVGQDTQIWEKVISVDSVSKSILYQRAQRWFVQTFKDSKDVLQLQDSIKGEIYGKAVIIKDVDVKGNIQDWVSALNLHIATRGFIRISIQILCKDNRYKYKIQHDGIEKQKLSSNYSRTEQTDKKITDALLIASIPDIEFLLRSLMNFMSQPIENENEDW